MPLSHDAAAALDAADPLAGFRDEFLRHGDPVAYLDGNSLGRPPRATVERVIRFKRGTGGSSGVSFLRRALELTFFPELLDVRTQIGS